MHIRLGAVVTTIGAAIAASELVNAYAVSRQHEPPNAESYGVVVLGYPSRRNGDAHPIQRSRVETAVRVFREHDARVMVMSGGAVKNEFVEADTMVELAAAQGVARNLLVSEGLSRTTWENVEKTAPLVAHCDVVLIVSEPLHAARARRYCHQQHPEHAHRVFVGSRRRPFERWWLTVPTTAYELAIRLQSRLPRTGWAGSSRS